MIELYTAKDLMKALKLAGLPSTRPRFNWYEKLGIIPKPRFIVHMHNSNYFKNTDMRLYSKSDIERIVKAVKKSEVKLKEQRLEKETAICPEMYST